MDSGRGGGTGPASSTFTFNEVFPSHSSSVEVYNAAARERVLTAVAGINATIFAYGPTGSGKTYTMYFFLRQVGHLLNESFSPFYIIKIPSFNNSLGPAWWEQACEDIFAAIQQSENDFMLRISAMEIYNERVRDLLKDNTGHQNLMLLDDPERGTVVDGLSEEGVSSAAHLLSIIEGIEKRRMVCSCFKCTPSNSLRI
jgi:centromeric protein E